MPNPVLTIYTLGDLEIFRAALTGVSMLFNPANTDLWNSSASALGLGAMVGLGLLITLFITLMQGVMTQRFELGALIMLIIVYVILFVPKFTLQIEDIYSGTVAAVDDIPLGVAIPASLVSNATYEVAKNIETAFSTADGNYVSLSTQGFVAPLRLLQQLRSGNKRACSMGVDLCATIQASVQDCLVGRSFDWDAYNKSLKPIQLVTDYLMAQAGGFTMIYGNYGAQAYPYPNGRPSSCSDAGAYIDAQINKFIATPLVGGQTMLDQLLNYTTKGGMSVSAPNNMQNYQAAFAMMVGSSGADATDFIKTALFSPTINNAAYCANDASNQAALAQCMPFVAATEQWKEDSAAAGSMFSRVMVHGMNIMLFMFYVFAPLMAIVIVAVGVRGLKTAGSYLMFGIWTQTWLPVAAMVNFYLQKQVQLEASATNGLLFTPDGQYTFYDVLSSKIAMAGDMMASVPLITLGMLSGSMYAVTSIAQRMGGKDYYDEKVNTPNLVGSSPIAKMDSQMSGVMGSGVMTHQGAGEGVTFGTNAAVSTLESNAKAAVSSATQKFGTSFGQTLQDMWSKDKSGQSLTSLANSLQAQGRTEVATGIKEFVGAAKAVEDAESKLKETAQSETSSQINESSASVSGGLSILGTGANIGGKISSSEAKQGLQSKRVSSIEATKVAQNAANDFDIAKRKAASLASGADFTTQNSITDAVKSSNSKANSTQLSSSLEEVKASQERAERAKSISKAMSTGISYNPATFSRQFLEGGNQRVGNYLAATAQSLMTTDSKGFDAAKMTVSQGSGQLLSEAQKNASAAAFYHLSRGTEEGAHLVELMSGKSIDISNPSSMKPSSNDGIAENAMSATQKSMGLTGAHTSNANLEQLVEQRRAAISGTINPHKVSDKFGGDSKGVFNQFTFQKDTSLQGTSNYSETTELLQDTLSNNPGAFKSSAIDIRNLNGFINSSTGPLLQMDEGTINRKNELAGQAMTSLDKEINSGMGELKAALTSGDTVRTEQVLNRVATLKNTQSSVSSILAPRISRTVNNKRE